jgi:hypothetical protein
VAGAAVNRVSVVGLAMVTLVGVCVAGSCDGSNDGIIDGTKLEIRGTCEVGYIVIVGQLVPLDVGGGVGLGAASLRLHAPLPQRTPTVTAPRAPRTRRATIPTRSQGTPGVLGVYCCSLLVCFSSCGCCT